MNLSDDGRRGLETLPFAPGEAPFRIKGTAYRGHLDYVAEHVPGGVDAMCEAMEDERLAAFFRQHFLASTLYDVFPLARAGAVCAAMAGMGFLEFVRMRAVIQAKSDVGGVYRVLLAMASPTAVATRLPRLVGQYFDFGETTAEHPERGHVIATRTGTPQALAPWYTMVSDGYCEVVLTRAGARNVVLKTTQQPSGTRHGIPIVDLTLDMRFD